MRRLKRQAERATERLPDRDAVRERLQRINDAFVRAGADDTSDADVERVVTQADAIEARFQRDDGPLGRLLDDGRLLLGLVRDAWDGRYRAVPTWTVAAAAFVLLYVLNPLDLIPDALPVVGVLDDAAVVSVALLMLERDLDAYRRWRTRQLPAQRDETSGRMPTSDDGPPGAEAGPDSGEKRNGGVR